MWWWLYIYMCVYVCVYISMSIRIHAGSLIINTRRQRRYRSISYRYETPRREWVRLQREIMREEMVEGAVIEPRVCVYISGIRKYSKGIVWRRFSVENINHCTHSSLFIYFFLFIIFAILMFNFRLNTAIYYYFCYYIININFIFGRCQ